MVLLSSKARGLADGGQDAAAECRSSPNPSAHYWISLPYNHIIGRKKTGSDETPKNSNTKSKEHEPDQLQEAEQVHLVTSCFSLDTCPSHVLDTLYLWLT